MFFGWWRKLVGVESMVSRRARCKPRPGRGALTLSVEILEGRVVLVPAGFGGGAEATPAFTSETKVLNASADTVDPAHPGPVSDSVTAQAPAVLINTEITAQV